MFVRDILISGVVAAVFCGAASAQSDTIISGVVTDRAGVPIPSATVLVSTGDGGEPLTGALTAGDGRFTVAGLAPGEYRVDFEASGFAPFSRPLTIGDKNNIYDLGRIALDAQEIADAPRDEIVVQGERRNTLGVEPGKSTYSMEGNTARAGGTVLDALKAMPGVTLEQDGKVRLRGSDRVVILLDGKQSGQTGYGEQKGLDSIPADSIDRIEIITNPSSKYDAAGMAGVINIIYKEDAELGFHGDVSLTGGIGQISRRKDDVPSPLGSYNNNPRGVFSTNLRYNTENVRSYLRGEFMIQRDLPNNEFTTRFYDSGLAIRSQVPENRKQKKYILKTGADWEIDGSNTLSLSTGIDYEHHIDRAEIPFVDAATGQELRFWFWREDEGTGNFNIDLGWEHAFASPGHKLSVNAQYTRAWEDEAYFLNEISPVRTGEDATHLVARENIFPVTVDYVRPLPSGRIEAGLKAQWRRLPIDYDVTPGVQSVIYPGLGDHSDWREDIYAAYGNYVREKSRYTAEIGVRVEQTSVAYDLPAQNIYYPSSDAYDYFRVYPNTRLTWHLSDSDNLSAFFNIRVDRPGEPELRIFPKYDDPELLKVGNPYLRPQFTKVYEVSYQHAFANGSASLAGFYRDIDDPFTRVFAIDGTNATYDIINRIYANTGHAKNYGVELIADRKFGDFWDVSGSFDWYRIEIDPHVIDLLFPVPRQVQINASSGSTWDAKLNNRLYLPAGIELNVTGVYYAARNISQGRQDARGSVDLGLSRPVMKGRAELVLAATDIFNTFGYRYRIDGLGFDAIYENFYQTQEFNLSFKMTF
ncbi:MAG: TonB-dependent receptor [Parvularculaceae bacterium]|nr:TonB-dependent receptor [Parvularculaceae bacterium]